ncbi:MAG: zinc-ribbon domain-containing protein, partial [Gammaproteobacteria bacterium]|nr:zinc-ribbon domain-containing protein [Gammaproteobacteria bacterium]
MLSQCPECRTVFRVRPEQLEAAGGKVRCSRCHAVFLAAAHQFHLPPS